MSSTVTDRQVSVIVLLLLLLDAIPSFARVSVPRANQNVQTLFASVPSVAATTFDAAGNFLFTSFYTCFIGRLRRSDGAQQVLAGGGSCGFADGIGTTARFFQPVGIVFHRELNIVFIGDQGNSCIRGINISTGLVSTAGGGAAGFADGVGTAAMFRYPTHLVLYPTPSGGTMYIADYGNGALRRYDVASRIVSTVATGVTGVVGLCGTRDGRFLYGAGNAHKIVRVVVSLGTVTVLAGSGAAAFADGVGTNAAFNVPRGVALNNDESLLIINDWYNLRVRQLNLFTLSVTTIAGTGAQGVADGPPLSATFASFAGSQWICFFSSHSCGVLVSDFLVQGSMRYVPVEGITETFSASPTTSTTISYSPISSASPTISTSLSLHLTTHTVSATNEVTKSPTFSEPSRSADATVTATATPTASHVDLTHSSTASASLLLSFSLTPTNTCSESANDTATSVLSLSRTARQRSASSSPEASVTATQLTPTRSRTQWECRKTAVRGIASGLAPVNVSLLANISGSPSAPPLTLTALAQPRLPTLLGDLPTSTITAVAPERLQLLDSLVIAFNVTLMSSTQLVYYYVTTASPNATVIASSLRSRDGTWHALYLSPPLAGWLPSTPVLLFNELVITVLLGCGDSGAMLAVEVVVPSPGVPRELADRVRQGAQIALIASLLATGAVSGSALGRLVATDSIALCDADAAGSSGVVDLGLVLCAASPGLVGARSTVVSNAVLILVFAVLLLTLSAVWWRVRCVPFAEALGVFSLPSSLLPVTTAAIPSTATATTLMIAGAGGSPCATGDVLLIALGLLQLIAPIAQIVSLDFFMRRGDCCCLPQRGHHGNSGKFAPLQILQSMVERRWAWRRADGAALTALRPAWVVLLEHRVVWYAAADCVFLVLVSALPVVGGLNVSNEALCRGCGAAVVAVLSAQLAVLAYTRPYTTHFSLVYNALTTALTCVSVAFQLAFVVSSLTSTTGLWLLDASAVCNLLVLGITIVKTLLDTAGIGLAVRRRVRAACGGNATKREVRCATSNADLAKPVGVDAQPSWILPGEAVTIVPELHCNPEAHAELIIVYDHMFWDVTGRAIGTERTEELDVVLDRENEATTYEVR